MSNCVSCGTELHPEVTSTICASCDLNNIKMMRLAKLNNTYGKFGQPRDRVKAHCRHIWTTKVPIVSIGGTRIIYCLNCGTIITTMIEASSYLNELEGKLTLKEAYQDRLKRKIDNQRKELRALKSKLENIECKRNEKESK